MRGKLIPVFLVFSVFVLCSAAWAVPPVEVSADTAGVEPGASMEMLVDAEAALDISQASSSAYSTKFASAGAGSPAYGFSRSAYWARIAVRNSEAQAGSYVVTVNFPLLDLVDFYVPAPDGGWRASYSGDSRPFAVREVPYRSPAFRFDLGPGEEKTVYLRVKENPVGAVSIPLKVWSTTGFDQYVRGEAVILGALIGIILVMTAYNLLLYLWVRDIAYLFYVLYAATALFTVLGGSGIGFQYLWPESPWLQNAGRMVAVCLTLLAATQFHRVFTGTARHTPRMDAYFRWWIAAYAVAGVLVLTPWYLPGALIIDAGLLNGLAVAINALYIWRAGVRHVRLYLAGWTTLFIAIAVVALCDLGLLPRSGWSYWLAMAGFTLEMTLFSLALGDRINSMKREAVQLRHGKEMAEAAAVMKDKFISLVSHDLKAPLATITGYAHLLRHDIDLGRKEESQKHVAAVLRSSETLNALVDSLLKTSRFKMGKMALTKTPIDMASLAVRVLAGLGAAASQKGVKLHNAIAPEPHLHGDETLIQEVLHNLVSNAIKFTHPGGTVTVHRASADPRTVVVRDTGMGIDSARIPALFNYDEKTSTVGTHGEHGSGLGLPLCRDIIDAHGGTIRVESLPGEGTSVYFTLG
ncbi:MAG: sensor histidine kinase [Nitrospinae bacterium]|nr:sensor histidine kinase [Nitrospinota bacterium]